MNFISRASLLALAAATAVSISACGGHAEVAVAPAAPVAVAHPAYLHALSDLRNARFNLARGNGDRSMRWDEGVAIGAIDRAINEITRAAITDGKNIDDHPAVDVREPRHGRLGKALTALRAAHADLAQAEDNGYAGGLKARAIRNVDEAIRLTEEGIAEAQSY